MARLELSRIDLSIYNKKDKTTIPARFYVNKDNEINVNILKGLLRTLTNKYGSISVQDVKLEDVINPATQTPALIKVWSQSQGKEIDVPLKRLVSFRTGFNRETGEVEGEQPYIIEAEGLVFKGISGNGKEYIINTRLFRDWKGEEPGKVTNSEILRKIREAIEKSEDGVSIEAVLESSEKGTLYIKDIKEKTE